VEKRRELHKKGRRTEEKRNVKRKEGRSIEREVDLILFPSSSKGEGIGRGWGGKKRTPPYIFLGLMRRLRGGERAWGGLSTSSEGKKGEGNGRILLGGLLEFLLRV